MKNCLAILICLFCTPALAQVLPDTVTQYDTITVTAPYMANTLTLIDTSFDAGQDLVGGRIVTNDIWHTQFATAAMVNDKDTWYCFTAGSNSGAGVTIIKDSLGNSPNNLTGSFTELLGSPDLNAGHVLAMDIVKDTVDGKWYCFGATEDQFLYRMSFGTSLASNTPAIRKILLKRSYYPVQLSIVKTSDGKWVGFLTTFNGWQFDGLYRINFGTSLTNIPTFTKMPEVTKQRPSYAFALYQEAGKQYLLSTTITGGLQLYDFGSSYADTCTIKDLGIHSECAGVSGMVVSAACGKVVVQVYGATRLDFGSSITNTPVISVSAADNASWSTQTTYTYNNKQYIVLSNRGLVRAPILEYPPTTSTAYNSNTVQHVFTNTGIHDVTLLANMAGRGTTEVFCKEVYVKEAPLPNGVHELANAQNGALKLYPVPANNTLNIDIDGLQPQAYALSVIDMQGRILLQQTVNSKHSTVNITALPAGAYTLMLKGDTGIQHSRFTIVR
ncbi:MAG: T9SS type A sorting domain-containing protein [Sphingobacteriales bacterium]|nr:MAG: T9SS type A sorting domain-containing protein [Sphingobacteriales bacterium]